MANNVNVMFSVIAVLIVTDAMTRPVFADVMSPAAYAVRQWPIAAVVVLLIVLIIVSLKIRKNHKD